MKLHYHIVTQSSLSIDEMRKMIYDFLPDDAPRGIHTLKVDKIGDTEADFDTACTYTVKDGDYIHSQYFAHKIEDYAANSYQKQIPYPAALTKLIDEHTDDEYEKIDWRDLVVKIVILRSRYPRMGANTFQVIELVKSIRVSLNNNYAEELVPQDLFS